MARSGKLLKFALIRKKNKTTNLWTMIGGNNKSPPSFNLTDVEQKNRKPSLFCGPSILQKVTFPMCHLGEIQLHFSAGALYEQAFQLIQLSVSVTREGPNSTAFQIPSNGWQPSYTNAMYRSCAQSVAITNKRLAAHIFHFLS